MALSRSAAFASFVMTACELSPNVPSKAMRSKPSAVYVAERQPSAAAESGSAADAGGSQLQGVVRLGMANHSRLAILMAPVQGVPV
jgi:hypothetical protein